MNQNTLIAVGNVITPVQIRHTPDGVPVTTFRIACNERRFNRETNEWLDKDSFFVSVTCWRRLAENVCRSLRSGDPVMVRGRLLTRSYDTADGRRTTVTEMEADAVGPDLTWCTAHVTRTRRAEGAPAVEAGERTAVEVQHPGSDDPWSDQGGAAEDDGVRELSGAVPAAGH
ncbi:single-stranded DNA-binding protein [Pseudonocardia abyssalis]|uniref:Single-stranded DNA-binding protein n=1 Tax=Pseudonocardia abyssalis TaxID=2792008 RepID=A0ABS6UK92_9PSEU|nr:single-stranded DNA-binding protein [Pseudonocardia abyssalis]MBW0116003.1 single-stranded DNA-binding protein [Pseudonocardia abyssalis]MBW0132645.1 single-stranded DNA-binding protein [Pseudonocardia abyssalis]